MSETTVTARHIEVIEHSLGDRTHWRNYYAADPDDALLVEMTEMGLMKRGRAIPGGLVYYHVTEAGKALRDARPRTERDSLDNFVRDEPAREAADRAMEGIIEARDYYDRVREEIERYDR